MQRPRIASVDLFVAKVIPGHRPAAHIRQVARMPIEMLVINVPDCLAGRLAGQAIDAAGAGGMNFRQGAIGRRLDQANAGGGVRDNHQGVPRAKAKARI